MLPTRFDATHEQQQSILRILIYMLSAEIEVALTNTLECYVFIRKVVTSPNITSFACSSNAFAAYRNDYHIHLRRLF